jgi:CubicO group peptidase (beta-lactamase class C family)
MRTIFFTALAMLVMGTVVTASDAFPDSQKGRLARAFVAAFNAGEPEMRGFLQAFTSTGDGPSIDERVARFKQVKSDLGTLTPVRLVVETASGVELIARTATGDRVRLNILTAGDPPHFAGLRVLPTEGAGDSGVAPPPAGPPEDERSAIERVRQLVQSSAQADAFSGSVLIARGADIVWQGAYGFANAADRAPNRMDTRFDVGSIVKSFTRVAIAQLVDAHNLAPSDTVGKYLPDYPNATVREKVTISQLLDMRSGLGDIFGPRFDGTPKASLRTLRDYLPLFANDPLGFAPGTGHAYSNGGYIVLGLIVEKVMGQSYYEYVRQHIFEPAGMQTCTFGFRDGHDPGTAIGYTREGRDGHSGVAKRQPNLDLMPARGSSAGSAECSAGDLLRYAEALAADRLVSSATARRLDVGAGAIAIAGGAPGLNASLETGVTGAGGSRYTVVVLSNYDPPSATDLARGIGALLQRAR